jgi:hypothetical protein
MSLIDRSIPYTRLARRSDDDKKQSPKKLKTTARLDLPAAHCFCDGLYPWGTASSAVYPASFLSSAGAQSGTLAKLDIEEFVLCLPNEKSVLCVDEV